MASGFTSWFVVTKHTGEILYSGQNKERVLGLVKKDEIPEQESRAVYRLYSYGNSVEFIRNIYSRVTAFPRDMKRLEIPRNILEQLLKSFDGS
jgi:hypothetical protein